MGLARIAGTRFAGWGLHFQTLMMAIIMINMLIGPPMFRSSLLQVGPGLEEEGGCRKRAVC